MTPVVVRGTCPADLPPATDLPDPEVAQVVILHPFRKLPLFKLASFDRDIATGGYGVERQVVVDACQVITNNRTGYLTEDQAGDIRLSTAIVLVPPGHYYLYLDNPPVENWDYPIVSEFSAWVFPGLPDHWRRLDSDPTSRAMRGFKYHTTASLLSVRLQTLDEGCMMTGFTSCKPSLSNHCCTTALFAECD